MPDQEQLKLIIANQPQDLKQIRLPGLDKSLDKLTIGELVQLRAGAEVSDSWNVEAVGSDVTISSSGRLVELGKIQAERTMRQVLDQARLNALRDQLGPMLQGGPAGMIGGRNAEGPGPRDVALPKPEDDIFSVEPRDPFKA